MASKTQSVLSTAGEERPTGPPAREHQDAPLRVLFTTAHLGTGGIARILVRTLPRFDPSRVEPHLCHFIPVNAFEDELRMSGITSVNLGHERPWQAPRTLWRLIQLVRSLGVELIHSNHALDHLFASVAARVTGVPLVRTLHATISSDSNPRWWSRRLGFSSRGWMGELLLNAGVDRFIAVSRAVQDSWSSFQNVPISKTEVVYSGVPVEDFEGTVSWESIEELRTELKISSESPVLLNVGRLHKEKGQRYLVPMMAALQDCHPEATLLIAGEGEERHALEAAIAAAGLGHKIKLLGNRTDIPDLLALADVFVFSSIKEGLPIAALEACAAGKPLVGASIDSLREVIEPGLNGLLVEPRNPKELARAVADLLSDPHTRRKMGRAASDIARRRFNLDRSVIELEEIYRATIAGRSSGQNSRTLR